MLRIDKLQVKYPNNEPVLNDVDLGIDNEKIVIVGPNGSGKSTLVKAVLRLAPIAGGRISVFGTDVRDKRGDVRVSTNLAEVYRLIYLPVEDLVDLFAELKGGRPGPAFKLLYDLGLGPVLKKRLHELSTGQQKLFGNVMAVSFAPKLVLLDEPFDNVDEARRRKLVEVFRNLDAEMMVITHELNLLHRLDGWSLYFLLDGRLWGKFSASQLDRLYVTKGEVKDALSVMDTRLGRLSVTLDHGDIAVMTATNLNAILERV